MPARPRAQDGDPRRALVAVRPRHWRIAALVALAASVAVVLLSYVLHEPAEPEVHDPEPVPPSARVAAPRVAGANLVRVAADWVPDGSLWIRPVDANGVAVRAARLAWAEVGARSFSEAAGRIDLAPDHEGWLVLPGEKLCDRQLVVIDVHHLPYLITDLSLSVRHEVSLDPGQSVEFAAIDIDLRTPVPAVGVRASRMSMDELAWQDGALPGIDHDTAVYQGVTDARGIAAIRVPSVARPFHVEIEHAHFFAAPTWAPLPWQLGSHQALDLQMPLVCAVRYVGARMIQGSFKTVMPAVHSERVRRRLSQLAASVRGEDPNLLAAVFLPAPFTVGHRRGLAKATFLVAEDRTDVVEGVRLDTFQRPVEISVAPRREEASMVRVRVLPPPALRSGHVADFQLLIHRVGAKHSVKARFGEWVELAPGRYRVAGLHANAGKALADEVFEVGPVGDMELQARWASGIKLFSIATVMETRIPKVGVEYERDGNVHVIIAPVERDGRVDVYAREPMERLKLRGRGYQASEVTLLPSSDSQVVLGICRMVKM